MDDIDDINHTVDGGESDDSDLDEAKTGEIYYDLIMFNTHYLAYPSSLYIGYFNGRE